MDNVVFDLVARAAKQEDRLGRRRRLAFSALTLLDEPVAEMAEVTQILGESAGRVSEQVLREDWARTTRTLYAIPGIQS